MITNDWLVKLYIDEYMADLDDPLKELTIQKEFEQLEWTDESDLGYGDEYESDQDPFDSYEEYDD